MKPRTTAYEESARLAEKQKKIDADRSTAAQKPQLGI